MSDSMEIIQKVILETLERDSEIKDTRVCLGSDFTSQQVIGVLMRLESHQVWKLFEMKINTIIINCWIFLLFVD